MLFITDAEFERIVSRFRNRQIAYRYFSYHCVTRIRIEYRNDEYIIDGTVMVNGILYTPRIIANQFSKIISTHCDCNFSDAYTTCAHAGAVILKVQELSPDTFPFEYKSETPAKTQKRKLSYQERLQKQWEEIHIHNLETIGTHLTNRIKNNWLESFSNAKSEIASLRIYYEYQYVPFIKFKIGNDRFYVIKNLNNFVKDMIENNEISYGKMFRFLHKYENLDDYSKKIYDFIQTYYHDSYSNSIFLNENNLDAFYKLVSDIPKEYISNLHIENINIKPHIHIHETKRNVHIECLDQLNAYKIANYHIYQAEDNQIKVSHGDEKGILASFLRTLHEHNLSLYIPNNEKNDFYHYILSPIRNYLKIDNSPVEIEEDKIEIYGDINEVEEAVFQIYGLYDDEKVNLLKESDKSHSVIASLVIDYMKRYCTNDDNQSLYFDTHSEETSDFLNEGIAFLTRYADIYVSENIKKYGKKSKMSLSVGIGISHGLLSIDIDAVGIPKEELAGVIKSYKSKKKYHKLKSGEMLYIDSNELEELSNIMDRYHLVSKDINDGQIHMNLNRAYALENSAQDIKYLKVSRSSLFNDIIDRLKNYQNHHYSLNNRYEHILRDYQKQGYQWLSTMTDLNLGGILADDMGLGKTLQIISLLENQQNYYSIVICPSTLVLNWADEIRKFSFSLKPLCIAGTKQERKEKIASSDHYDILITSYDLMRRDIDLYKDKQFDFIILDEAQYIKNQNTKNALSVKKLNGYHKFALTGTPIENSLAELWSIFDFLNKDYLFHYHYFREHYESPIVNEHDEKKQRELKKLIAPFILRRTKKEVLKELPDKIENNISIEFTKEERKLYFAHLAEVNKELRALDTNRDRIQILAMLTRLRQICCEPRMLFNNINHLSSKMNACLEIIDNYYQSHKKLIIFSSFSSVLGLLEKELKARHIKYHMITGATPSLKRKPIVDAYQKDDSTVFLISLKAGGTGLNLTAAEGVIHFDPWWNMSAQSQATDRAHRIGQENIVFVYKLIMKDSLEEKIQELQNQKKQLSDTFVEGNEGAITNMTSEEIMSLFK